MDSQERKAHWEQVYTTKAEDGVSWFQENAKTSLGLIDRDNILPGSAIIDIGGGASRLVDGLLGCGFTDVSVLDVSAAALATAKARLGAHAAQVSWIEADIVRWKPERRYDVWHDRAVLHFLTHEDERNAYLAALKQALLPGALAVIGTFAMNGPKTCSGLPVQRYSPNRLSEFLGADFAPLDHLREVHRTPSGVEQRFQFSRFRYRG